MNKAEFDEPKNKNPPKADHIENARALLSSLSNGPRISREEQDGYYSQEGQKFQAAKLLAPGSTEHPVYQVITAKDGSRRIDVFTDGLLKPSATVFASKSSSGEIESENFKLFVNAKGKADLLQAEKTVLRDNSINQVDIKLTEQKQAFSASFADGVPRSLSMTFFTANLSSLDHYSYVFEKNGDISGVTLNGKSVEEPLKSSLLDAGRSAIKELIEKNALSNNQDSRESFGDLLNKFENSVNFDISLKASKKPVFVLKDPDSSLLFSAAGTREQKALAAKMASQIIDSPDLVKNIHSLDPKVREVLVPLIKNALLTSLRTGFGQKPLLTDMLLPRAFVESQADYERFFRPKSGMKPLLRENEQPSIPQEPTKERRTEGALKAFENLAPYWTKSDAQFIVSSMLPDAHGKSIAGAGEMLLHNQSKFSYEVMQAIPQLLIDIIKAPPSPIDATLKLNPFSGKKELAYGRKEALTTLNSFRDHITSEQTEFVAELAGVISPSDTKNADLQRIFRAENSGDEMQKLASKLLNTLAVTDSIASPKLVGLAQTLKSIQNLPADHRGLSDKDFASVLRIGDVVNVLRLSKGDEVTDTIKVRCRELLANTALDLNLPLEKREAASRAFYKSNSEVQLPVWAVLSATLNGGDLRSGLYGSEKLALAPTAEILALAEKYKDVTRSSSDFDLFSRLAIDLSIPQKYREIAATRVYESQQALPDWALLSRSIHGNKTEKAPTPETLDVLRKIGEQFPGQSTQQILYKVQANMAFINALPGSVRANVMGWDKLPDDEKKLMGWTNSPEEPLRTQMGWDALSEFQRENLRWAKVKIDGPLFQQLIGDLYTGEIKKPENSNALLLGSAQEKVAAYLKSRPEIDGLNEWVSVASSCAEYRNKINNGDLRGAHSHAYKQLTKCGAALEFIAPELWKDIYRSSSDLEGGVSIAAFHFKNGHTHTLRFPTYDSTSKGFEQALGHSPLANSEVLGLKNLEGHKLDYEALKSLALNRIDADPLLKNFNSKIVTFSKELSELQKMVDDLQERKDNVDDKFIEDIKERIVKLRESMKVSPDDLKELGNRIALMESASRDGWMKNGGPKELTQRIEAYKSIYNLYRGEKASYPGTNSDSAASLDKYLSAVEKGIAEGKLRGPSTWSWVKENIVTIGVTVAAVALTVASFGTASPVAAAMIITATAITASELATYGMYKLNQDGYSGWGDPNSKGPAVTRWLNEHGKENLFEGGALLESAPELGLHYGKELLIGFLTFRIAGGLTGKIMGGLAKCPPANAEKLGLLAAKCEGLGTTHSATSALLKAWTGRVGKEFVYNAGFTGVQLGAEHGIKELAQQKKIDMAGESSERALSFGVTIGLCLLQGARGRMRMLAEAKPRETKPGEPLEIEFRLAEKATPEQFVKFMETQGYAVRASEKPGVWEMRPLGCGPDVQPIVMSLASGSGEITTKLPHEVGAKIEIPSKSQGLHPDEMAVLREVHSDDPALRKAHNKEREKQVELIQNREKLENEVVVNEWTPTAHALQTRKWLHEIVAEFNKGNYEGAHHLAALGNKPNNFSWKSKDIEVKAGDLNTPEGLHKHIKAIQEVGNAKKEISTERGETKIEHWINEPVTVIVLESGVKVNILSQKVEGNYNDINGKVLDAKSLAEFRAIKESPAGQRVLMGHAMCTIEEMFHMQQFADSQAVISKTYADFLSKNAKISRADDYYNAVNGLPHSGEGKLVHNRSMRTMEQEVVAALYDAKMPVEILRLYYECNYPVERRPIMDYLRQREQSGK